MTDLIVKNTACIANCCITLISVEIERQDSQADRIGMGMAAVSCIASHVLAQLATETGRSPDAMIEEMVDTVRELIIEDIALAAEGHDDGLQS